MELFAKPLIQEARDPVIEHFAGIMRGQFVPDIWDRPLGRQGLLVPDGIPLVVKIVDVTLHSLLSGIEDGPIKVFIRDKGGDWENVADVSDGLGGELWGSNGWIAKYSRFESSENWGV